MKVQQVKTIEDLIEHFADHGEVIHTEGECVWAIDYGIESAFYDKEEFIRLFIEDASSEQLFMIRKIIEKSFSANDACLLYTSPSPRDVEEARMPSSA